MKEKTFVELQKEVHDTAVNHGWWDDGSRNFGEVIALIHSELSEALEYARTEHINSDHIPEFTGIEEEFADVIIRIMDYSEHENLRLYEALLAKMEFNKNRPYKHGGKKF